MASNSDTEINREDISIVTEGGMPCIEVAGAKIRLRCLMTHEDDLEKTIGPDDLDVEKVHVGKGCTWRVTTPGEHQLNFDIEPELIA